MDSSGPLATRHPATGNVPNFCIDVSSEHTPINFPPRKDSFNLENELTNTVAASEDFGHLLKRFVACSSQHSAASTVPTLLNLGSVRSTGELVRGNDSIAGSFFRTGDMVRGNNPVARVEESVFKGNRDHDSNSVRTSSDKQNLHKHLERKAESAVRGENAAQKRLSEAEAGIDGEQKGSELALCHTHQELASQRLQQHQANQWADQALREKISLCGKLDMRNRLFNESRTESCQEIEELRRICCEDTDRARRARIDELSRHQERFLSTAQL